jgi:hypothetical protein
VVARNDQGRAEGRLPQRALENTDRQVAGAAVWLGLDHRLRKRYRPAMSTSPEAIITVLPGSGRKWKSICQAVEDAHVIWIGSLGSNGMV